MISEQDIIRLLSSGDAALLDRGLGLIYRYYGGSVKSMLKGLGASKEEQEDVIQEVLIVVLEKFASGTDSGINNLKYYILGIARNLWLGELRRMKRLPLDELGNLNVADKPKDVDIDEERIELISNVLDDMIGPCRELLKSFYYERKSNSEIAELLGYNNADTVKSKKYKCLQRLRDLVRDRLNAKG